MKILWQSHHRKKSNSYFENFFDRSAKNRLERTLLKFVNSHAGGWSLWTNGIKSIFMETFAESTARFFVIIFNLLFQPLETFSTLWKKIPCTTIHAESFLTRPDKLNIFPDVKIKKFSSSSLYKIILGQKRSEYGNLKLSSLPKDHSPAWVLHDFFGESIEQVSP